MKRISKIMAAALAIASMAACNKATETLPSTASPNGTNVFEPTWESIRENYQIPEWFRDAKFGIFIHWGVYSVPAFDSEWYPRNMYQKDSKVYNHHIETYGKHTDFGYKDFIPMFKAEKFDAAQWAKLFKEAGAKYVIPVAEHHDGFAMYDSELNPWNAMAMGPHRDVIAELKDAILAEDLIFGVSSHRIENGFFYNGGMEFDSDVQDTTITLYGKRYPWETYTSEWAADWLEHTKEIVDKYQPSLLWFDWTVNNDTVMPYFNEFMAYYYNSAIDWDNGGVVVNTKQGYPTDVQVWDMERGKTDKLMINPWQTDTSVGKKSWSYIEGEVNKTPEQIVHDLVDIVSKNGNLLLNIGPRADGTITEEQADILRSIGKWLAVNGDAIYGTRPWKLHGEGENEGTKGSFTDNNATAYTAKDIRFTTKGNDFYAIMLNWAPEAIITSLTPEVIGDAKIQGVTLLGCDEAIDWQSTPEGLKVKFPKDKPCEYAYAFKIAFDAPVGENLESEATNETMKHG